MSARLRSESGFSLLELLVAMTVMLVVLGGTMEIMTSAMNTSAAARQTLDMNSHLRAAMDLIQRDLLQVGQGLPVGRRIGIPNDDGSVPVQRPGPGASGACPGVDIFPIDSSIPAVSVGADLGPPVNGECTDVITILSADNSLGALPVAAISADGATATIHNSINIADDPDLNQDNIRAGDLLMFTKGSMSVLMQVTGVAGQQVMFGNGAADPLNLNQLDPGLTIQGTINQVKALAPADPNVPAVVGGVQQIGPSQATRIRMVTYWVDTATNPAVPRLVRAINGAAPNAVGLGVQALRFTYDIADQVANPTSVRMNDDDLAGFGECAPDACSENQIRKVNVVLSMTVDDERTGVLTRHGTQSQNVLYTQVSLRNMAFVDRYR